MNHSMYKQFLCLVVCTILMDFITVAQLTTLDEKIFLTILTLPGNIRIIYRFGSIKYNLKTFMLMYNINLDNLLQLTLMKFIIVILYFMWLFSNSIDQVDKPSLQYLWVPTTIFI